MRKVFGKGLYQQTSNTDVIIYTVYNRITIDSSEPLTLSQTTVPPGWLSGERVGPDGCKFDTRLRRTFFPACFRLSPLLKHVRKVVGGFGKKVVLVLVRENRKTHVHHRSP